MLHSSSSDFHHDIQTDEFVIQGVPSEIEKAIGGSESQNVSLSQSVEKITEKSNTRSKRKRDDPVAEAVASFSERTLKKRGSLTRNDSSVEEIDSSVHNSRSGSLIVARSPISGTTPNSTLQPSHPDSDSSLSSDGSQIPLRIQTTDDGNAHSNLAAPRRTRYNPPPQGMSKAIRPSSSSIYGG
jgi:hypothetical protein